MEEIDYGLLKQALREVLSEEGSSHAVMAPRFRGGKLVIKPADNSQQPKEVPIEDFFKKVVRVRDQLRLLEQKVNGHGALSDEDKRVLQGYLTRAYGTLTTFNLLFQDKTDNFVGQKTT
ncbi:hypothetical protein OAX78_00325 [Planctomycetota bacterium]|nr:hypothetical protein [Planctomycetota bacterium]